MKKEVSKEAGKQICTAIILIPHLNQQFYLIQYSPRNFTTMKTTFANSTSIVVFRNYNIEKWMLRWMKPLLGFLQASIFHRNDTIYKVHRISLYIYVIYWPSNWVVDDEWDELKLSLNSAIDLVVSQHL